MIVERGDPGADGHVEAENAPQGDWTVVEPGGAPDTRIPRGRVGEFGQVVEGLLGGTARDDGPPATRHWGVLSPAPDLVPTCPNIVG